jgi:hypothetical protein
MSHEFDGLDATEKAGLEAALNRCRALATQLRANSITRGPSTSLTSCRWQTFTPPLSTLPMSSDSQSSVENTPALAGAAGLARPTPIQARAGLPHFRRSPDTRKPDCLAGQRGLEVRRETGKE